MEQTASVPSVRGMARLDAIREGSCRALPFPGAERSEMHAGSGWTRKRCRVLAIAMVFVVLLQCPARCERMTGLPCATADVACKTDAHAAWLQAGGGSAAGCKGGLLDLHPLALPLPALVCSALLLRSSKLSRTPVHDWSHAAQPAPLDSMPDPGKFLGVLPESVHARQPMCIPLAIDAMATLRALQTMCMSALTLPCRCSRFWAAFP